jgi:hypothetical protein
MSSTLLPEIPPRRAATVAYVAAGLNLVAAGAMFSILRPGLPVAGSQLLDRVAYLGARTGFWWGGWLVWHAAAIALVAFYVALAATWSRHAPLLSTLALLCATAGLAADLSAEALYMGVAPRLRAEAFALCEDIAGIMTGYLANGLYTISGILLTWAGARQLPRFLVALAVPLWASGLSLSAASLIHSASGQFWSTAILMPLFVIWTFLVGRWLSVRAS